MGTPREILSELLSPSQAAVLDSAGRAAWRAAARALGAAMAATPGIESVEGALVMPEEIAGSFGEPHLVAPIEVSCDGGQTGLAYVTVATAEAAAAFNSQADEPADEEQQTLVVASTALGQVLHAINQDVFEGSSNGLTLSLDDPGANTMPAVLGTMEDPVLLLTATIAGSAGLPVRVVLPAAFLDIVASNLDVQTDDGGEEQAAGESVGLDLPFTLSADELDAAALVERERVRADAGHEPEPRTADREPTPISRARFAPLEEPDRTTGKSGIDLLAGLRMNVSVELGRTELTVAEVLGLGSGSVIELDRLAGEPVDILVNDRLIARGEVVVVDENFGVRVVEVVRRGSEVEERAV